MLNIWYPFRPFIVTQRWGNPNPLYAGLGFTLHNGIDASTGRTDWQGKSVSEYPVYCPVEDFEVESITWEPQGGGNQLSLVSRTKVQVGDKLCHARIFLCHAKKILVKIGDRPKLGELLMIADNTGLSTGVHTHVGLYRLDDHKNKLDVNDATGSYDPASFFTGKFAVDVATTATLITSGLRYVKYLTGMA